LTVCSSPCLVGLFHPISTCGFFCPESAPASHELAVFHRFGILTSSRAPQATHLIQLKAVLPSNAPVTPRCFHLSPNTNPLWDKPNNAFPIHCHATRTCPASYEASTIASCRSPTQSSLEVAPHTHPLRQAASDVYASLPQVSNEQSITVSYDTLISPTGQWPHPPPEPFGTLG